MLTKLVILKKGGEPGEIAINPDMVSHVRQTPGQFTDIYFGETRVAVEGTFRQVVEKLTGAGGVGVQGGPAGGRQWISAGGV
jgi:hypothetical protein